MLHLYLYFRNAVVIRLEHLMDIAITKPDHVPVEPVTMDQNVINARSVITVIPDVGLVPATSLEMS